MNGSAEKARQSNTIKVYIKELFQQQDADVKEVRELLAQKAKKEALLRQKKGILADAKSKKEGKFEKMGKEELEVLKKLMEEKEEYERFSKQLQPIMDIHRASVILTDPENGKFYQNYSFLNGRNKFYR